MNTQEAKQEEPQKLAALVFNFFQLLSKWFSNKSVIIFAFVTYVLCTLWLLLLLHQLFQFLLISIDEQLNKIGFCHPSFSFFNVFNVCMFPYSQCNAPANP